MDELRGIAGSVTVVTGFEKGSGKTTFLNHALPIARKAGPIAAFTIGVDGSLKAREAGMAVPEIRVEEGDVVLTTETFARASAARFEVLECLPGRTALGRLLLGRAVRAGSVTLVGPEHLSLLAEAIDLVRRERWVGSVLVDGAVNRITQVSALGEVRFAFTVRADRSNLARVAARVRAVAALSSLPGGSEGHRVEGPLTAETLKQLPQGTSALSIEDFTKVFLEPTELSRTLERYRLHVRRTIELLCFAVTLRDVTREAFLGAVGADVAPRLLFNPYEIVPSEARP